MISLVAFGGLFQCQAGMGKILISVSPQSSFSYKYRAVALKSFIQVAPRICTLLDNISGKEYLSYVLFSEKRKNEQYEKINYLR